MAESKYSRYRYIKNNHEIETGVFQLEYLCVDPDGYPFMIGNLFIKYLMNESEKYLEVQSVLNYFSDTCYLLNYLHGKGGDFFQTATTNEIRRNTTELIRHKYKFQLNKCKGNYYKIIHPVVDPKTGNEHKPISLQTLRNRLNSWKIFYEFLIEKGIFKDENPFRWRKSQSPIFQPYKHRKPPLSGLTKPHDYLYIEPNSYFRIAFKEWTPETLPQSIDTPLLKKQVIECIKDPVCSLITRLLFETGARIHEILAIDVGDLRNNTKSITHKDQTIIELINKGSHSAKTKKIRIELTTYHMITHYINGVRRERDMSKKAYKELPDFTPLFLNTHGTRITRACFYSHFRKGLAQVNIKMTIHQIRHWYVTNAVRQIHKNTPPEYIERTLEIFSKMMGWTNNLTVKIYDHFVGVLSADQLQDLINTGSKESVAEYKSKPALELPSEHISQIRLIQEAINSEPEIDINGIQTSFRI